MLSRFSCVQLFATPWTVARQAPLSMGFSRQEYWSGLPCPPPQDLPNPGIKPVSPASPALQAGSLPPGPPGKPYINMNQSQAYMCPLHPEPPPTPPSCPRGPALGALLHASNSNWSSVLHMVMYVFQHYSLNSSHPLLLPLSPSLFFIFVSPLLPCT